VQKAPGFGVEAEMPFISIKYSPSVLFKAKTFPAFGLKLFPPLLSELPSAREHPKPA